MLKMIGIVMVFLGASGTGFSMAWRIRHTTAVMQQLRNSLSQMRNEISYRRTPLPELLRLLAVSSRGEVAVFWNMVADGVCKRQEDSVGKIVRSSLNAMDSAAFSGPVRQILQVLGDGMGTYDVEGQVRAITLAETRLQEVLNQMQSEQSGRMRSYCTLGICAGLAIAILAL